MKPNPKKIEREKNEIELRERKKHRNPTHSSFRQAIPIKELFNFLVLKRAFGPTASNVPAISGIMYIHADPVDQGQKKLPEKESKARDSYGTVRIESLKRGNSSCTELERDWLHWAFINAMNPAWGEAVSKDQLAELSLESVFQLGFAKDLPWPDGLECAVVLKSLVAEYGSDLIINPRDWPTKLGSNSSSNRENLVYDRLMPNFAVGYEYLLDISNIHNPKTSMLFVFEASDRPMKIEGDNELKELFVSRLIAPKNSNIELTDVHPITKAEIPFAIQKYTGVFTYYALSFPNGWEFEDTFEVSLDHTEWNSETSQKFLRKLHQNLHKYPSDLQLTAFSYEVS